MSGYRKQMTIVSAVAVVIVIVVALGAYYNQPQSKGAPPSTALTTLTSSSSVPLETTSLSSASTETVDYCGNQISLNGTTYCSLNVTNITSVGVPGFATMYPPVDLMGVYFRTTCQDDMGNCGTGNTTMFIGDIMYNIGFHDGTNQNVSTPWSECTTGDFLTDHQGLTAGFYLECVKDTQEVILIVQSA
jgi:hypothetical protein